MRSTWERPSGSVTLCKYTGLVPLLNIDDATILIKAHVLEAVASVHVMPVLSNSTLGTGTHCPWCAAMASWTTCGRAGTRTQLNSAVMCHVKPPSAWHRSSSLGPKQ